MYRVPGPGNRPVVPNEKMEVSFPSSRLAQRSRVKPPRLGGSNSHTHSSFKSLAGVKSVYDTAPWRTDANASLAEKNKEETIESKSRQQLNKVQDETLRHLKRPNNQNSRPILKKKRAEQSLSTRLTKTIKPLLSTFIVAEK